MKNTAGSVAATVVGGCFLLAVAATGGAKEGAVKAEAVSVQDARPAIDRAAPAKTERAVFALG